MATITSLDFNVKSNWDGSGIREARADLDLLKTDLDEIGNKSVQATVGVKIDNSGLDQFKADLDAIGATHVTATAGVNVDDSGLTRLRTELDQFGAMHVAATATVNVDDSRLTALRATLQAFNAEHVTATATVNTDTARLDALRAELTAVGATHVTATAAVNVNRANLDALRAELSAVGSTHATASANVNVNRANLDSFQAALTRLGNEHVTAAASVNVNRANLDALESSLAHFGSEHVNATAGVNTNRVSLDALEARLVAFGAEHHTATADVNTDSAHVHLGTLIGDVGSAVGAVGGLASAAGGAGQAVGGMGGAASGAGGAVGGLGGAASSAAGGLGSMASTLGTVALYMTAVVALAPIAAASVALIPVGFILAATTIIASNKQLQKSFKETFKDTLQTMIPLVMPVITALEKAFQQLDGWVKLIGPAIKEAFQAAAPLVQPLFNILEKLIGGALPGFTLAMKGMTPLLDGMGQGALKLGGYLGQAANVLARIPGLGQAMNGIMGAAGQVILAVAQAIAKVVATDHGQALIQLLQLLAVAIKAATPLLQFWAIEITGLAVIMRGLGDVIIALEVAFKAFMQLLSGTGPIVNAFKVAWDATWNALKIATLAIWDGLKIAWNAVVNGLVAVWNVVAPALKIAWDTVWNAMKVAAQAVWNAMQIAWSAVVSAFSTVWTTVSGALVIAWNAVWNGMKTAAAAIWTAMQVAWSAVVTAFSTVWTTVSGALVTAWNTVWNAMKVAAQAIWTAMQVAWSAVVQAFATIWNTVSSALSTAWNAVWNAMKTAAVAIWNALQAAWTTFLNALHTAWTTVSSALSAAWSAVWNAMKTAAQAIWNAMQAAWNTFLNTIKTVMTTVTNAMKTAWEAVWTAIKGFAVSTWNALKTAWDSFTGFMKSAMSSVASALKSTWETVWNAIKGFAVSTWNAIRTAWDKFAGGLKTAVSGLVDGIKKIWSGIQDAFKAPIHFVIATVINGGILKAINWVVDKLGGSSNLQVPVPFAQGGAVNGPGTGTSDSILARLSTGEHVWTAAEVSAAGGHQAVANMRSDVLGASARTMGSGGMFAGGGGVATPGAAVTSIPSTIAKPASIAGSASGGLSIGDIESIFADIIKTIGGAAAGILAKGISGAGSLAKAVGGGIQSAAGAVAGAAGHVPVVGGAAKKTINAIGHFFGGGGKAVSKGANVIADALAKWGKKEFESAAGDLINKVIDKLPIPGGNGPIGQIGSGGTKTMFKAFANKAKSVIADFLFQQNQTNVSAHAVAGPKAVKAWAPVVLQALQMEGHPASWLGAILTTMAKESGGNPNAINKTDINAQHGIPSQGLMQVIPPTFAQYHEPGTSNNILDPLANIAAAINYIVARYGVPTGKSPYATGTNNATPGMHLVGENGPEMVMFGGGETVKTASETSGMLGGGGAALPLDQMQSNLGQWTAYMQAIADTSASTWQSVKDESSSNVAAMGSSTTPVLATMKSMFDSTGNNIAAQWKSNWNANSTLFANNLNASQTNASNFNALLRKNFTDNNAAVAAGWKNSWDTNSSVFLNNANTTQTNATGFNATLKKNYADNNAAVSSAWKTAWDTNGSVFLTDTNTTQTDATTFQNTLKTNFATNQTAIGAAWKTTWDTAATNAQTDFTTMNTASTTMWAGQKATFDAGSSYLQNTFFPPVNDLMVNKLPASFNTSVTNIGSGWLHLEAATHDPVAAVVDVVYNKGIVGVWNLIAKAFGAPTLAAFTMPGFASGGAVNGPGTGTSDSVVARLSAGEHVWTAREVSAVGGHQAMAQMRANAVGGSARAFGSGDGRYAVGGAVVTPTAGGNPTTPTTGATAAPSSGGTLSALAAATLGSIHQIANPLINAAVAAGKVAVDAVTMAGSGMRAAGENMGTNMGKLTTDYITQNDILPTFGGGSDTAAQAWADSRVGEPYVLGGDFVHGIDCSEYQSGIARAILGQTPAPWFTTFAFNGSTAPPGFVQNLQAPYMVGVTNVGVGHMAGTLNGKNYEATPPAVRSGPSARGWNDPMFSMHYGFQPSVQAAVAGLPANASHLQIIDTAMAAAHVPPPDTQAAWESGLNIIITHESAWNPNAINNTDINAQNGIPSQGLAQVIPPTFSAYHVAGTSTNILDPIANVAAAIRYIVAVYGSINNVPGVRSVNAGGAYLPYRHGTDNASKGWHLVGEDGPEMRWFNGGEKVWDAKKTKDWMDKVSSSATTGGSSSTADIGQQIADAVKDCVKETGGVNIHVPITVSGSGNPSDVVARVESELIPKLRMMMEQHVGRNRGRGH